MREVTHQASRFNGDLALAHTIADRVDQMTLQRFRDRDFSVSTKADLTPVTEVDRECEQTIRSMLSQARGRDAVVGEEHGSSGHSSRRWIIDPIDGTKNYVRGVPVWATLIGLEEDGEMVAGLVSAPALGRRWWAAQGGGAYTGTRMTNGRQIQVSAITHVADASLSYSSMSGWVEHQRLRGFFNLAQRCWRTRAYGDFWSYMLLAEGAVDIAAEPELELYDMAALVPIVREAGGRFTSLEGEDGCYGGNAVATNSHLHTEVLAMLAERDRDSAPNAARDTP